MKTRLIIQAITMVTAALLGLQAPCDAGTILDALRSGT